MKTGAEAIRALATQLPVFRQKLSDGWYQIRIAGRDTGENELSARLNEPLEHGAVIHIVPRLAGAKSGGIFQAVLGGGADCGCMVEPLWAGWGAAVVSGMYAAGGQYDPRRCGADAGPPNPEPPVHRQRIMESRTRISPHWITWLPGVIRYRCCTVKCAWGHVWYLRKSARQTKGTVVRLW